VLLGDFNSYTEEDPMQVFYEAGYTNVGKEFTDEQTYLFGARVGSLDHVLTSESLVEDVAGADIWNINSVESIGLEYSRYNGNVTNLYAEGPFRSSDHDPLIMGLNRAADDDGEPTEEPTQDPTDQPTEDPTGEPTDDPSQDPTDDPTGQPTDDPSTDPTADPTDDGRDDDQGQDDDDQGEDNDDQGDNGQGGDDQGDNGDLPRTGTGLTALVVGGGLLVVGAIALLAARRRAL